MLYGSFVIQKNRTILWNQASYGLDNTRSGIRIREGWGDLRERKRDTKEVKEGKDTLRHDYEVGEAESPSAHVINSAE